MRPQEKTQNDLFEQAQSADKRIRKKTRFLLPDVRNTIAMPYETMIFIIIGFVMMSVAAFSLGVEKGRFEEKKKRAIIQQPAARNIEVQPKTELKKGVPNVTTSKPKNIKGR